MDKKLKIGLAVIIALIATGFAFVFWPKADNQANAVNCQTQTCFSDVGISNTLTVDGTATFNGSVTNAGSVTNSGAQAFTSTLTVGTGGTALSKILKGTCTLVANASIAATSTGYASCTTTGTVTSGDIVFVTLATTSTAVANNFVIAGAQASTSNSTSIEVKLLNLTGTAAVPAATAGFGSSTQYLIIR